MNEDKGTRYRRLERGLLLLEGAAGATALLSLACSGVPVRLRDLAASLGATAGVPPGALRVAVAALLLLALSLLVPAAAAAPFALRRHRHLAARFGLPGLTSRAWMQGHVRRGLLLLALGTPAWLLFARVGASVPWLSGAITAAVLAGLATLVMLAAPWLVMLSPRVRPIRDEALTGRLHGLTSRAGLRLAGLHEWVLGRAGRDANAAIVGVVGARRLLLSDGLLEQCLPEEVEAVVAHELGHHVHGHTWRRLRAQALSGLAALLGAQLCAAGPAAWSGTAGVTDPASLPWMLLGAAVVWVGTRPWRLTQSRLHESEADAFALQVTGRPEVLERVLARLSATNLTSDDDSLLARAFFLTHPPVATRIAAARRATASVAARSRAGRGAPTPHG